MHQITSILVYFIILNTFFLLNIQATPLQNVARNLQTKAAYSIVITTSSPTFQRPYGTGSNYHYESKKLTVTQTGTYMFFGTGDVAPFARMYENGFDPANLNEYFMSQSLSTISSSKWFNLTVYLEVSSRRRRRRQVAHSIRASPTYYFVLTTYDSGATGRIPFDITGPGTVNFADLTTSTNAPTSSGSSSNTNLGAILGGVLGSVCTVVTVTCGALAACLKHMRRNSAPTPRVYPNIRPMPPQMIRLYRIRQQGSRNRIILPAIRRPAFPLSKGFDKRTIHVEKF